MENRLTLQLDHAWGQSVHEAITNDEPSGALTLISLLTLSACSEEESLGAANVDETIVNLPDDISERPNILLILVDDMGFADLGVYGSEIRTPNIDALARSGVMMTQMYTFPVCAPTRAGLMSGVDPHLAGLGMMAEARPDERRGKPGYEGYLNNDVVTIARLLKDDGYHTYMAGKWHLGLETDQGPAARGFEKSVSLPHGGASHFSDRLGITIFDPYAKYNKNGETLNLPEDFYSTTFYTDSMIEFIDSNQDDDRPFFGYLSYTAPHWPLQAPEDFIDKYQGAYDEGYEVASQKRLVRMRQKGLLGNSIQEAPFPDGVKPWDALVDSEKRQKSREMEIYAAMVEKLDDDIGKLLAHLEKINQYEDTLIIFLSDNGPEAGEIDKRMPFMYIWLWLMFDNSAENMGRPGSYIWYGPGWAHVSAGPLGLFKGVTKEGGIRVPAIFHYPRKFTPAVNQTGLGTIMDVSATILDFAKVEHPGETYNGRSIHPLAGRSLIPMLENQTDNVYSEEEAFAVELSGHRAVRQGNWKAVWLDPPHGKGGWTLYNILADPGEVNDLSDKEPEKLAELVSKWGLYVSENNVLSPPTE